MRALFVVGARPNFPKVAPLLRAAAARGLESVLLDTGQHYSPELSARFFADLGVRKPDFSLGVGSGSHAEQVSAVMVGTERALRAARPDIIVVVGDTNSALGAALAAAKANVPVAHVEAGLRSFDRSMPEETNRVVIDAVSTRLFSSEPSGTRNLIREGRAAESVVEAGNVMVDSLLRSLPLARESGVGKTLGLVDGSGEWGRFALLTIHRPSNTDDAERFSGLMDVASAIAEDVPVIFPAHPRTRDVLARRVPPRVRVPGPLGYLDFLRLMQRAALVLTDSGGVQEETTVLDVPCLTLRENTERPLTVERGTNVVVGTEPSAILAAARGALRAAEWKRSDLPWNWDGHAAERVVAALVE